MLPKSASICLVAIIFTTLVPGAQAKLFGGNKPQIRPASTSGELTPRTEIIQSKPADSEQANDKVNDQANDKANDQVNEQNNAVNLTPGRRSVQTTVTPLKKPIYLDRSKMFTYDLPEGWQCVQNPFCDHDILTQSASGDKTRNICTTTYHPHVPKNKIREEFEKILCKNFDDCKVTESAEVKLACGKSAVKIQIVGKVQGLTVRQTTFVIPMSHGVYLTLQGTGPKEGDEKASQDFQNFVDSFKPAR